SSDLNGIYVGKIKSIVKGMEAAFVEYQPQKMCFLPFRHLDERCLLTSRENKKPAEGDEVLIQITGEAVKSKDPEATTRLSLAGKYAVISMQQPGIFFSRKLSAKVTERFSDLKSDPLILEASSFCGIVIRSNAGEADITKIKEEIGTLYQEAKRIFDIAAHRTCYSVLFKPEPSYLSVLRDYPDGLYDRIITDVPAIHDAVYAKINEEGSDKTVSLYSDESLSLWNLYCMQKHLDLLKGKKVHLPCGGYLVIEHTEALTAIDVNSGKADMGKDREAAYCRINQEAAKEIASQMILRNLSGMILVDFINLKEKEHEQILLDQLRELVQNDPATASVIDMTPLGLVEITRMKKRRPLHELLSDFL
nr:ribonuclease E/G [Lachnospiraceae bacterium]